MFGWIPHVYEDLYDIPPDMPLFTQEKIKNLTRSNSNIMNKVGKTCLF